MNLSDPTDTFWRSISKDNITTWYGKTTESRITDPADPSRIFSWMICQSHDDKGNVISYQYKAEDYTGVDLSQANESNRSDVTRSANRYVKNVFYGNRTPYFPDLTAAAPVPLPADWCFQLVFDYGEHNLLAPLPLDTGQPWICRPDSFSSYRPTFEVRTYRLCRRALMFHHFADQPTIGLNCLVRSTDLYSGCKLKKSISPAKGPGLAIFSFTRVTLLISSRMIDLPKEASHPLPSAASKRKSTALFFERRKSMNAFPSSSSMSRLNFASSFWSAPASGRQ